MNKAVFLDRDGTINVEKEYVYRVEDFEFIPGVKSALRELQAADYRLVVISNQSGVARGYYSEDDVKKLNAWLTRTLAEDGIFLSGIYFCPHHPDGNVAAYRTNCDCRKPGLGLFYRAAEDLDIDFSRSFAIGDRMRDLRICEAKSCGGYLVGSAQTRASLPPSVHRAPNLAAAAGDVLRAGE